MKGSNRNYTLSRNFLQMWAGQIAQWEKCLLNRPDDLSFIPRSHIKKEFHSQNIP